MELPKEVRDALPNNLDDLQKLFSRQDNSKSDYAFIAGAIVGAIAGALVTLALTPMSGQDTREALKSKAEDLGPIKDKASNFAHQAQEKASEMAATGKEKAQDLAAKTPLTSDKPETVGDKAEHAFDDAKDAVGDAVDDAKDAVGDAKRDAKYNVDKAADAVGDAARDVKDEVKDRTS